MRKFPLLATVAGLATLLVAVSVERAAAQARTTLDVYTVDVEGGKERDYPLGRIDDQSVLAATLPSRRSRIGPAARLAISRRMAMFSDRTDWRRAR